MGIRFSAAIKAGMRVQGIRQTELGRDLGVSRNTVSRWVTGQKVPDYEQLNALKERFGWTENKLQLLLEDWHLWDERQRFYRISGVEYVARQYDNDYVTLLDDLIEFDLRVVPGLRRENEGTSEQWAPTFYSCPDSWRLLTFREKIVGYWQIAFLQDQPFNEIMSGSITDSGITIDLYELPVLPGAYNMYIVMFGLDGRHQTPDNFNLLFGSLVDLIERYARSGWFFKKIGAVACSHQGVRMCNLLGMEPVKDFKRNSAYPDSEITVPFLINGSRIAKSYVSPRRHAGVIRKLYTKKFLKQQ